MTFEEIITNIKENITDGKYKNETAVREGIVKRILEQLDWPHYDPDVVYPEFPIGSGNVDYALCNPQDKPKILIEVKRLGNLKGGEEQLFKYCYLNGVSMAILTDGREWQFYLPTEEGAIHERKAFTLDIFSRSLDSCVYYFNRYLKYNNTISNICLESLKTDFKNNRKEKEIKNVSKEAFIKTLKNLDDSFIESFSNNIENFSGYVPSEKLCLDLIESFVNNIESHFSDSNNDEQLINTNRIVPSESSNVLLGKYTISSIPFLSEDSNMRPLYEELKREIMKKYSNTNVVINKYYVSFKDSFHYATAQATRDKLKIGLRIPFNDLDNKYNIARNLEGIGNRGSCKSEITISSFDEVEIAMFYIEQSWNYRN